MTEILAIDDDREILAVIKKALLREGYQVTALEDPLQLEEDKLGRYQLILLDVMMPGIDGFDLCRRIREKVDCPILFLTAKTEEKDVMTGLGAGGDDYITKPFGIGELRARVAAHIRRENREKTHTICIGEVRFSMQERKIYVQEHELVFTKAEYTICEFLALNHGQVFSKERILEHVFGFDGDSNSSAITEHVKNIRAKFQKFGINPIEASVICLVANTTPTAFGAVGLPVITLAQTAGLDVMNTAFVVSLQLSVLILVIPYILVGLVGGGVKTILYLVGLATGQLHF